MPQSANALWRANRGRLHRSDRYAEWRLTAGWELKAQRPGRIDGPVEVSIAAGRPDRRCRDIDNLAKSLQANRIEDDTLVTGITTGWDSAVPAGVVRVTIVLPAMAMADVQNSEAAFAPLSSVCPLLE